MFRILRVALVIPALVLTTTAAAPPFPASVDLPPDFQPEGIAVGTGSTFYVGSLRDGDIYVGDLRSGQGELLVDTTGRAALGLKVDEAHHRLFVAGGPTGRAFVYDTRDGELLANVRLTDPFPASLINDVVVTHDAAYFTDSFRTSLFKLPIAPDGTLGAAEELELDGPAASPPSFVGLNGIDAPKSGGMLVVAHSDLGALFTVDPETGDSAAITLTGGSLTAGTPDGILLDGKTLWVVENSVNRLVEVRLSPDLGSGRVVSVVTNDDVDGAFQFPTTVAEHGHRLAVVNARFDLGFPPPFGPGAPPGTTFNVVVLDKP